jgi:hypothetical protein
MSGSYPSFKRSYRHEELVEPFLLTPAEVQLVLGCRGDTNRCGMALLLKTLGYLGYVPDSLEQIPAEVRSFVAGQLGLLWDFSDHYGWDSRTRGQHLSLIRQHTGWRFPTRHDKEELEHWLRTEAAFAAFTTAQLFMAACQRLRTLHIELPTADELERGVNAALSGFFQDIHHRIATAIPSVVRQRMDSLLLVAEAKTVSLFETLKAEPGKPGVDNLQTEITKLQVIRAVGLEETPFVGVPWKVLQMLKRRASNEKASEMREHPEGIRYALLGCFLYLRSLEVTDDVTRMAIEDSPLGCPIREPNLSRTLGRPQTGRWQNPYSLPHHGCCGRTPRRDRARRNLSPGERGNLPPTQSGVSAQRIAATVAATNTHATEVSAPLSPHAAGVA